MTALAPNQFSYDNPPQNTPPEVLFPPINNPPQNQPNAFGLTDEELFEQDMLVFLEVQAEEQRQTRAREAYAIAKEDRRNRRVEWRWKMGLNRVPSSEDDSSDEGYGTD